MGTATAEARLVLNAQGVEDGAKRAEAAFQRITAGEGQMRRTIEKPVQHGMERTFDSLMQRESKVRNNLVGIAQLFTSGAGAADILTESAVRLSETFKTGLGLAVGVGVAAAFAKNIYEAAENTEKLEEALQKLQIPGGSVANSSMDELQQRLKDVQSFREGNKGADPNSSPFSTFMQGYGDVVGGIANTSAEKLGNKDYLGAALSPAMMVTGGIFGGSPDMERTIEARSRRDEEARKLVEEARSKIAEKFSQNAALDAEAQFGDPTKAALKRNEAKTNEARAPFLNASNPNFNPEIAKQIEMAGRRAADEISLKANLAKLEEDRARGLTSLQAEHGASPLEVAKENLKWITAERDLIRQSGNSDQKRQAQDKVLAAQTAVKLAEEEQDITRRTSEIMTEATRARVEGEQRRGDLMERNAMAEAAATRAANAGNPEEEAQIRARESLKQFDENVSASYDHSTGHARTADLLRDIHKQDIAEKQKADAEKRLRDNAGLLSPERNTHGEVIGGIDPKTGKFIGSHDNDAPPISVNKNGERTFGGSSGELARIGNFGSKNGPELPTGAPEYDPLGLLNKSGGKSTAAKEMADLQSKGAVNVGSPDSGGGKGGSTGGGGASDSGDKGNSALNQILGILESWNK